MMEYLVVIEQAESNYSAYLPDLPGCVATGETPEETMSNIRKAIDMHLRGLKEDGFPVPLPTARAEYLVMQEAS
jgi:predicted RNase H-like HicB family nuclease